MTNAQTLQSILMDELNLKGLSDVAQKEVLLKMTELIMKKIILATFESLKDNDVEELIALQEKGADHEQIHDFLKQKIDNYEELLQKIIIILKEDMRGMINTFQQYV